MGNAGTVIIFVMCVVATGLVGLWTLFYASHCFFVIVEQTSAGVDRVIWPDEPFVDWLGRGIYLAALLVVCAFPAAMLAAFLAPLFDDPRWLAPILGAMFLLLFPIIVLSALTSESAWGILHPLVLMGMAYHFLPSLAFYAMTEAVAGTAAWLLFLALSRGQTEWLLLAPVIGATAFLIYARLLGRMAWLIGHRPPRWRKSRTPEPPISEEEIETQDPWAAAAEPAAQETDEKPPETSDTPEPDSLALSLSEEDKPYALVPDEPEAIPLREALTTSNEAGEPVYTLHPEDRPEAGDILQEPLSEEPRPRKKKRRRKETEDAESTEDDKPPATENPRLRRPRKTAWQLLLVGVYEFPWYSSSAKAWCVLTILGLLLTFLGHTLLSLWQQLAPALQ
jgi:hypothetical protein